MPQIIVTAGDAANLDGAVTLRERINISDFESTRFATNLLERLGWAVSDAAEAEGQTSFAARAPQGLREPHELRERHESRERHPGDRELVEA